MPEASITQAWLVCGTVLEGRPEGNLEGGRSHELGHKEVLGWAGSLGGAG